MARELAPCGTPAAARRHWRNGEPLDDACLQASRREKADRKGFRDGAQSAARRETRNGLPEFRPYAYRGTGRDTLTWWMT